MPSTLEQLGSFAGLASFAFLVWDRLLRGHPLAYVVAAGASSNARLSLRVENLSAVDILITGISAPGKVQVWRDASARSAASAIIGEPFIAVIEKGATKDFPLVIPEGAADWFWLVIYWRRASASWLPMIPKFLRTGKRHLALLGQSLG